MRTRFATAARLLAAALLALAVSRPVAAQDQAAEFDSQRLPGWSFTPMLGIGFGFDNNVALTSPTAALGETQGDTVLSMTPAGRIEFFGKRTDFSAGYRGFLRRYADVEGLDNYDQRSNLGFKYMLTRRFSVFARNNFADTPTTDETEVNGVPFRRVGSQTNTFAGGGDYRLTKFTTAGVRYDMTWVGFDRLIDTPGLTGGWIHAINGNVSHQLQQRLALGGEYSYRSANLDEGERDVTFHNAGATMRYDFGPHTSGTAAGGLATLDDHSTQQTRSGPYIRLALAHELERTVFGAAFERQYVPSFGFGGASSSQDVRVYVRRPLMRRFYVQGSAAWRRSIPYETDALQLDTTWIRSTFGFAATRWAHVEALYAYTRQDSIVVGGEINRHRVGVQLVVSQPMRIQ